MVTREQFPDVEVNLYRYDSEKPVGLVVVAHGGALINGDADMTDSFCDTLRNDCKCCVASINYKKLAQQKPPYQQQEIIDVTQYFMKNASSYNLQTGNVVMVGFSGGSYLQIGAASILMDFQLRIGYISKMVNSRNRINEKIIFLHVSNTEEICDLMHSFLD